MSTQIEDNKKNDGTGPLQRLPARLVNFKGREAELQELDAALRARRGRIFNLYGAAGVGKSALALTFAHELADRYPYAQFFVDQQDAGAPQSATALMRRMIWMAQPSTPLPEDEAEIRAAFAEMLQGRQTLFLVDNALANNEGLTALAPREGCLTIVTSRQRLTAPELFALKLGPMAPADAECLLLQMAPRIGKLAAELAELAGGWPLALEVVGGTLAAMTDLDPAEYADRLMAEQWNQAELDEAQAALELSYNLLKPELQRCWRILSVFPGDFGRLAAGTVWAMDDEPVDQALADLWRRALVSHNSRSRRFRLHDLARTVAATKLDAGEREEAQQRHSIHYVKVLEAANLLCLKGGDNLVRGLRIFDLEQANIRAGQAWAGARAGDDATAARLATDYSTVGTKVLPARQLAQEHMTWLEAAGRAAQNLGDRAAESQVLSKLGSAYRRQSQPRWAIDFYERQLRLARETGDHLGEGTALGNLGLAYAELGNYRRAIAYYEQHLELARELGDRQGEARTCWNLGLAFEEVGDLSAALAAMQVCLDFERAVGHPDAEADAAAMERLRARQASDSSQQTA